MDFLDGSWKVHVELKFYQSVFTIQMLRSILSDGISECVLYFECGLYFEAGCEPIWNPNTSIRVGLQNK